MRYPTERFLAVTMVGALGWLLIIFTLFSMFGPPFIAVFGLRWIIALVVFVSGGGATIFMVFRKRKDRVAQSLEGSQTSPRRLDSGRLRRASRFGAREQDPTIFVSVRCTTANLIKQAAPP